MAHGFIEADPGLWSYEEVLAHANSESAREFDEESEPIRYVAFLLELADFCLCEFEYRDRVWIKRMRVLAPHERLPGENLSDDAIHGFVARGRNVTAVNLYRARYGVGHHEAVDAVRQLRAASLASSAGTPPRG